MIHVLQRAIPLALVALAGGCASLSGFEGASSSYSCPLPEGSTCKSMSQVYRESVGAAGEPRHTGPAMPPTAAGGAVAVAVAADAQPPARPLPAAATPFTIPGVPAPLLTRPRVLRVYIAPWADANDTLLEGRRAYLKLDDGRWRLDHFRENERKTFAPAIAPPAAPTQAAAPRLDQAPVAAGTPQGLPTNPFISAAITDQQRDAQERER